MPFQTGDAKLANADISKVKIENGYDPKFIFKEGMKEFVKRFSKSKKSMTVGYDWRCLNNLLL